MEQRKYIRLGHGSGGRMTHDLVSSLFLKYFDNEILRVQSDAGLLPVMNGKTAFSTDAYVVDPIFFPGGNIGTLAVSGTVNDLAVAGAVPLYLSAAFIIEEGFPLDDLETIVRDMASHARKAGVRIVAGDTKVVHKDKCDKIFITTAGVGTVDPSLEEVSTGSKVRPGDSIIVSGFMGDHGIAVLAQRESLSFSSPVRSDAACLNEMIAEVTRSCKVHFMRDATRGGMATVLAELAQTTRLGIRIAESAVPVREAVKGICEVFGYDPLYMANEGKVVMVIPGDETSRALKCLKSHPLGTDAAWIGSVEEQHPGKVILETEIGGQRFLDMLAGEQLPRIC